MANSKPRIKALIIAPHASANFGGESIIPLHYFRRLKQANVEPFMILHERTKTELSQILGDESENITYIKDSATHRLLYRFSSALPNRIGAFTFGMLLDIVTQIQQRRLAIKIIKEKSIDVVHEPIRVSPKTPSIMFSMGVPVVIGPLNGGMKFPESFQYLQGKAEKYFTIIGRALARVLNFLIPGKRFATIILVANDRTRSALPTTKAKVKLLVENGVDLSVFSPNAGGDNDGLTAGRFTFAYLGRLVDWKCVDSLVYAAKNLTESGLDFKIEIIGDGREKEALQELTLELGVSEYFDFLGFLPQEECAERLHRSDCLVLPSVYECGGAVVLEAMAMSKPVIAADWGGPADYLTDESGVLVSPFPDRESFIESFADAMETLVKNRNLCKKLGNAGNKIVKEKFDWDKKIQSMREIYDEAIILHHQSGKRKRFP